MTTIGFIGVHMVRNLVEAGFAVRAHDARPEGVQGLAGVTPVATTAASGWGGWGADGVITMLPDTPEARAATATRRCSGSVTA